MRLNQFIGFVAFSEAASNIPSSKILPPRGFSDSILGSPSTVSTPLPIAGLSFVGAPSSALSGGSEAVALSIPAGGFGSSPSSGISLSLTSQAVASNMNLQQCVQQVQLVNREYYKFNTSMIGLSSQVDSARNALSGIDIVTHNILIEQSNFQSEIERLNVLYNTLSVRANALGKWMSDEKGVRDNLKELYRQMYARTDDEDSRLSVMQTNVATALTKLADVQKQTAGTLNDIALAQTSMFDWAVNVTIAVNTHTTKLNSLTQGIESRINQIDTLITAMRDMAQRLQFISQSLGETNLAYTAAGILTQIQSVLNPTSVTDSILSVPSSNQR